MVLAVVAVRQGQDFWGRRPQPPAGGRNMPRSLRPPGSRFPLQPLLVLPPTFTLDSATPLAQQVRHSYPKAVSEFVLDGLPEDVRREVVETAQTYYEPLLAPARAVVLARLREGGTGSEEMPE